MGWGLHTQLLNSLIINENRDGDLNTRKHCRGSISNTPPRVSCNIYLVDTSKLVLIIRAVRRFSTCFSVSRSSDETLLCCDWWITSQCICNNIIGPSALKVWASSRPTFWRILFWEGISFRKNKIIHKMRWFFSSLLLTTILKLVNFLFSEKRTLEIYLLPHRRTVNKMSHHFKTKEKINNFFP